MIVRAARPDEYGWIVERTGLEPTARMRVIEAVNDSGRIVAQIAGTNWTPNSVMVHWAVEEPAALRALVPAACEWIYNQAGRGIALGMVAANNDRSMRAARHIGFRELYRLKDGHAPGVDLVAMELRKEGCRWLSAPRKAA